MLIDAHVHVSENGKWFETSHDASIGRLLREMDAAKVDRAVLLPLVGVLSNKGAAKFCRRYPDRLLGFGTVDLYDKERTLLQQVDEIRELGLRGIKLHPRFQEFSPNSETLFPLYDAASTAGLPIVFCGWPQCRSRRVTLQSIAPYVYDRLAKQFPELKIVIAHMGGHRVLDAYFVARSNSNVYLDASYAFWALKDTSAYQDLVFTLRNLTEKVIFGSDFPEMNLVHYTRQIMAEVDNLRNDRRGAILAGNLLSIVADG